MNTGGWPYSTQYPEPLFDERGNPLRWSLVDGKAIEDKPNEDILSCFLGKVFRPAEGRYAPDESWPGKDDFPFYPTLDSALYNRHWSLGKQGLSRYVIEFPVIVLATNYAASPYRTGNALLLIGKRPFGDKPFEGCAEMVFGEPKISPFLSAPRWLHRIWCSREEVTPAELPFCSWHRARDGATSKIMNVDLAEACDFVRRFNLHLQKVGTKRV